MKKFGAFVVGLLVVVGIVVYVCMQYRNGFVEASQSVKKSWANVENQYQRRLDLIPNLVNSVKGYTAHESGTLEAVTNARAGLKEAYDQAKAVTTTEEPQDMAQFQQAQSNLNRQLGIYVNAVHEAYPELKANELFMDLQNQLEGTENRIATERTRYNDAVEQYNVKILKFPASLFAWGYSEKQPFQADPAASKAPKVDFGTGSAAPEVDF